MGRFSSSQSPRRVPTPHQALARTVYGVAQGRGTTSLRVLDVGVVALGLTTADVPGIDLSGLLVDAGPVNSPVLMQIGTKNGNNGVPHNQPSDPTGLQDVFFRVGGPHVGKATVSLEGQHPLHHP